MSQQQPDPPSISHRVSLRFLPAPPTEHTATLVLNAGRTSRLYTDFRPFLSPSRSHECEWAFAGTKRYLPDGRREWVHYVDTRDDGEPDVAETETLPDGTERETGEMRNPETGRVEPFEEIWRDEEVPSGARVLALRLVATQKVEEGDGGICGVFVRVGRWAQGVVAINSGEGGGDSARVSGRRWKFDDKWTLVRSYGPDSTMMPIPRGSSLDDEGIGIPRGSAEVWEVVEDYTWNGSG